MQRRPCFDLYIEATQAQPNHAGHAGGALEEWGAAVAAEDSSFAGAPFELFEELFAL
jgi:hypothetical protein